MRRSSVVASAIGVLSLAGACALPAPSPYEMTPSRAYDSMSRQQRDSVAAQSIADREGPGVRIRADMESYTGARRVRAFFQSNDDAYVVIGQIGPDGVLRIVFPTNPHDDGFVQGGHSYQTAQFFAGYADEYSYRLRNVGLYNYNTAAEHDSYDGGLGYLFVIASWRPMHVEQFSDEGRWDTFELTDEEYMRDPRPAVHELASLLVGDQPEAYTVKFASYFNTLATYNGASFFNSAYGLASCGIGSSFGFGYSDNIRPISYYASSPYYLDQLEGYSDCYSPFGGYYGIPTVRVAQNPLPAPVRPSNPAQPRAFNPNYPHTRPEPHKPGGRMPITPQPGSDVGNGTHFSTEYRLRGLITDDGSSTQPRRRPGVEAHTNPAGSFPSRPSIDQMVQRHANDAHEGWSGSSTGRTRTHAVATGNDGTMRQGMTPTSNPPVTRSGFNPSSGPRGYSSPSSHGYTGGARYNPPSSSSGGERSAGASHPAPAASSPPPSSSSSGSNGSGGRIKP